MSLQKADMNSTYTGEMVEYQRLFVLNRTTTGVVSFTSSTSGLTYNSTTGQKGIFDQLQAFLQQYQIVANDFNSLLNGSAIYSTTSGSSNAYTAITNLGLVSYNAGLTTRFCFNASNTGASTLNFDSLGVKNIKKIISKNVSMTNLMTNGNLTSTTGLWFSNASGSLASNKYTFTVSAQNGSVNMNPTQLIQNHIYYACIKVKSTSNQVYMNVAGLFPAYHSGSNTTERLSSLFTWTPATGSSWALSVTDGRTSSWNSIEMSELSCFDLTAVYGAGNEPTDKTMFDNMLTTVGWFSSSNVNVDGKYNLDKNDIIANGIYQLTYDGIDLVLLNPSSTKSITDNNGRYHSEYGFNFNIVYSQCGLNSNNQMVLAGYTSGNAIKTYTPSALNRWGNYKITLTNVDSSNSASVNIKSLSDVTLRTQTLHFGENIIELSDLNAVTYPSLKVELIENRNTLSDASPLLSNPSITWEGNLNIPKKKELVRFITSGTFDPALYPATYNGKYDIYLVGGGGGGGGGSNGVTITGGGGGGGFGVFIPEATISSSTAFTIGGGGTGASGANTGGNGGTTTILGISASGGTGGAGVSVGTGGTGGNSGGNGGNSGSGSNGGTGGSTNFYYSAKNPYDGITYGNGGGGGGVNAGNGGNGGGIVGYGAGAGGAAGYSISGGNAGIGGGGGGGGGGNNGYGGNGGIGGIGGGGGGGAGSTSSGSYGGGTGGNGGTGLIIIYG